MKTKYRLLSAKVLASVALSLIMIFSSAGGVISFAAEVSENTISAELLLSESGQSSYVLPDGFMDLIFNGLFSDTVQGDDDPIRIDVSSCGIPAGSISEVGKLIFTNPRLFPSKEGFSYTTQGGYVKSITFKGNPAANKAMYEDCEKEISALLYGIKDDSSLSDVDKALLAHDRLIAHCEYDYARLSTGLPIESYMSYGALVNRISVCEGYTLAYMWMLDELGIRNEYVSSSANNHSWAKVYIGSVPYYADLTYDDPVWDIPGQVKHENFLVSYAEFNLHHNYTTVDFDTGLTSTVYDNYFPKASRSEVLYVNGSFYYLRPAASQSSKFALVKRTKSGSETELLYFNMYYRWASGQPAPYAHPRLLQMGDEVIYSANTEVRSYNVKTGENKSIFTATSASLPQANYYILGMRQISGRIYVYGSAQSVFASQLEYANTESFVYCSHPSRDTLFVRGESCAEGIEAAKICTVCGDVIMAPSESGHSFEWIVTRQPGCVTSGEEQLVCAVCGFVSDSKAIPPKDHSYSAPTYTWSSGYASCTARAVCSKDSSHVITETASAAAAVTTAPTCTEGGAETVTASFSNEIFASQTKTVTLPAAGHSYQYTVTNPTCEQAGSRTGVCSVCSDTVTETIPATGHSYTSSVSKAATCTEEGVRTYTCVNGDDSYTEVIGKLQHTPGKITVPATCTDNGTEITVCGICGETLSESAVIPALGHSYTSSVSKAATCTGEGIRTFTCVRCGDSYTEVIGKLQHVPGEWVTVTAPTKTAPGRAVRKCAVGGEILEEKELPMTESYPAVSIRNYKPSRTEDYQATLTFTADVTDAPDGAAVHWFVNGKDVYTGEKYTVEKAESDYTVQAKLIGSDNGVIAESETETVKINSGFFAKLASFFKRLFSIFSFATQSISAE